MRVRTATLSKHNYWQQPPAWAPPQGAVPPPALLSPLLYCWTGFPEFNSQLTAPPRKTSRWLLNTSVDLSLRFQVSHTLGLTCISNTSPGIQNEFKSSLSIYLMRSVGTVNVNSWVSV